MKVLILNTIVQTIISVTLAKPVAVPLLNSSDTQPENTFSKTIRERCSHIMSNEILTTPQQLEICSNWTRINQTHVLDKDTEQDVLCLLYHDTIISFCNEMKNYPNSTVNVSNIAMTTNAYTTTSLCEKGIILSNKTYEHKLHDMIKGNKSCLKLCGSYENDSPVHECAMAHYFATFNFSSLNETKNGSSQTSDVLQKQLDVVVANSNKSELIPISNEKAAKKAPIEPSGKEHVEEGHPVENVNINNQIEPINQPPVQKLRKTVIQGIGKIAQTHLDSAQQGSNAASQDEKSPQRTENHAPLPEDNSNKKPQQIPEIEAEVGNKNAEEAVKSAKDADTPNANPVVNEEDGDAKLDVDQVEESQFQEPDAEQNMVPGAGPDGELDLPPVDAKPQQQETDENPISGNDEVNEIDGDSYFFSYFMVICVIFILGYVGYHNRLKVMALILEGKRNKRQYRGRRPNSANYHKLDSNLEEAISSNVTKNMSNVIY